MHQLGGDNGIVTPAHLILAPSDLGDTTSPLSFKSIGVNSLKESAAFPKVRNFTKACTRHLVYEPSKLSDRYSALNTLYSGGSRFLNSSSLTLVRQRALPLVSSLGAGAPTGLLDSVSFSQFLNSSLGSRNFDSTSTSLSQASQSLQAVTPANMNTIELLAYRSSVPTAEGDTLQPQTNLKAPLGTG